MIRFNRTEPVEHRRGAILLVVLSMLALFAVLGISFLLYAESQSTASRIRMESLSSGTSIREWDGVYDADVQEYVNIFLGQLVYDVPDDQPFSGVRGYSLARTMYGWNALEPLANLSAYSGQGLITDAEDTTTPIPRSGVLNYSYLPASGVVIDPEHIGVRADPSQPLSVNFKNVSAPYTYPGLKDLFLAQIDPQAAVDLTRQFVVAPSFFRYGPAPGTDPMPAWVFNPGANPLQRLAPPEVIGTNVDWTSPQGRFKIIRPRPFDHTPDFPYPPPNPDGTYTGDVQNLPGEPGVQRNDSIWIYPGGPVRESGGTRYTALIAPLIIDLGGRVNLSTAGNVRSTEGSQASYSGLGQHEINPLPIFQLADGDPAISQQALVNLLSNAQPFVTSTGPQPVAGRYGPGVLNPPVDPISQTPSLIGTQVNSGGLPRHYAGMDIDGATTDPTVRAMPVGEGTSPFPVFSPARYWTPDNLEAKLLNHPAQFQYSFFPRDGMAGRTFNPFDLKWLSLRVYEKSENLARSQLAQILPEKLIASGGRYNRGAPPLSPIRYEAAGVPGGPHNPPIGAGSAADPAAMLRQLLTSQSPSTHRPEVQVAAIGPANGLARLGPIDLSRPLPDYRVDPSRMLLPDNIQQPNLGFDQWAPAQIARQQMAMAIFVRLAAGLERTLGQGTVIDGTGVVYVADPTALDFGSLRIDETVVLPESEQFTILRRLAQLAVNIVDYIDPDDIITPFTWNLTRLGNPTLNPMNGMPLIGGGAIDPAELGNFVVFGTELPKLVVNEVYAELTNNRQDYNPNFTADPVEMPPDPDEMGRAQLPLEYRFWVELFNPMRPDPTLSEGGMARLFYPDGAFGVPQGFSPYQIVIATGSSLSLNSAVNSTGSPFHPTAQIEGGITNVPLVVDQFGDYMREEGPEGRGTPIAELLTNQISLYNPAEQTVSGTTTPELYVVHPHEPNTSGVPRLNRNGFYVIGPSEEFPGQSSPDPEDADDTNPILGATLRLGQGIQSRFNNEISSAMSYPLEAVGPPPAMIPPHTVILRRLANPYLPPNDPESATFDGTLPVNPYVVVDLVDNVNPNNNVHFTNLGPAEPRPQANSFNSIGRAHPYSRNLLGEQTQDLGPSPRSTFFLHNSQTEQEGVLPFRWLTHLDRRPINATELFGASAVPPHMLTDLFAINNAESGIRYNRHSASRLFFPNMLEGYLGSLDQPIDGRASLGHNDFVGADFVPPFIYPILYPALDLFGVRMIGHSPPVGAPTQGKINLNAVWHPSVLNSLLDPNPGNNFTELDVEEFWNRLNQPAPFARSPSFPFPLGEGSEQPLMGLIGTGLPPPDGVELMDKTIFRHPGGDPTGPVLFDYIPSLPDGTPAPPGTPMFEHGAARLEGLRKLWNNAGTTSDGFLVIMTVGIFEVADVEPSGRVRLGKEMFRTTPGDMRAKYVAYVDRSKLALEVNPDTMAPEIPPRQAEGRPWTTTLMADVQPGATELLIEAAVDNPGAPTRLIVFSEGEPITIAGPDTEPGLLHLGFGELGLNGAEGETLPLGPIQLLDWEQGVARIQLAAPVSRYHPAGTMVTNTLFGNPGPQRDFDYFDNRFRKVVPFVTRIPD